MKSDVIKAYAKLHDALLSERSALQERLAAIDAALAGSGRPLGSTEATSPRLAPSRVKAPARKLPNNPVSLRAAIERVTAEKPLTKQEILEAVRKLGYRFATQRPMASISTALYSNKRFRRNGKKFTFRAKLAPS